MGVEVTSPSLLRTFGRRVFFWFILPLFSLFLLAMLLMVLLCYFKSDLVAATLQQQLRSTTSLPWLIKGPVKPSILPFPGLSVSNVRVVAASLEQERAALDVPPLVSVRKLRIYPDILALVRGKVRFHLIRLDGPDITLAYDAGGNPLWIPLPGEEERPLPPGGGSVPAGKGGKDAKESSGPGPSGTAKAPSIPRGTSPPGNDAVADALAEMRASNEEARSHTARVLKDLRFFLQGRGYSVLPPLKLRKGAMRLLDEQGKVVLSFADVGITFTPDDKERPLSYSARFSLPPADLELHFAGYFAVGEGDVWLNGGLEGEITLSPPESRPITAAFNTDIRWEREGTLAVMPGFVFKSEGDLITASLEADVMTEECRGRVLIHSLSLPRWFKWARNLPPGLQQPLHGLSGEFTLFADARSAFAKDLTAEAGSLKVRGYVGTPDFSRPEVVVDLDLDEANLDYIFPFLTAGNTVVPEPKEPVFDVPYLVPYPGGDPDAGPDVGYDVTVRVKRPRLHQLSPGPLEVKVFPMQGFVTRVAFSDKNVLGGSVDGWLDIDRGLVRMHYDVKKVGLAGLPENIGSAVKVEGSLTCVADIDIKVDKDGHWADVWQLKAGGELTPLKVVGGRDPASAWWLNFGQTKVKGEGPIHTVRSKGIRIDGVWDVSAKNIQTSWYASGNDAIDGKFKGAIAWPPMGGSSGTEPRKPGQKGGVERVYGEVNANGRLIVPLGSERVPLAGKVTGNLDWNLHKDTVNLAQMVFRGLGSYVEGSLFVDGAGELVTVSAPVSFNIAPRVLLAEWKLLPSAVQMPEVFSGKSNVTGDELKVVFASLDSQADGAAFKGEVTVFSGEQGPEKAPAQKEPARGAHWVLRLTSDRVDLDNYVPPAPPEEADKPPSKTPWDLSFLKNLSLDIQLTVKACKFRGLLFLNSKVTGALQRSRYSLQAVTADFYGGTSTILMLGLLTPENSQMTVNKGLVEARSFDLGKALFDASQSTSYGGKADLTCDLTGVMRCNADMPAGLSGFWNLSIRDGLYPAFLGSETAGLRNTFSTANASGKLEKGVMRFDNFVLKGVMVDMTGDGWVDFPQKTLDIRLSVTLAKVPTVPVRFSGTFKKTTMNVRGVDMVVDTAEAAGSTVLGIFKGIIELPGRAVRGVGDLFGGGSSSPDPGKQTAPAPRKVQPGTAPVRKPSTAPVRGGTTDPVRRNGGAPAGPQQGPGPVKIKP